MNEVRILVVRLGALGDIVHTLPAVCTLKTSFPSCHVSWVVESKWATLLEGNPYLDEIIPAQRRSVREYFRLRRELGERRFTLAVDFQGLIKSALVASAAGATTVYGLHRSSAREPLAALLYSRTVKPVEQHVVDRHLEIAAAIGARQTTKMFPLPEGTAEGELPGEEFVLASPQAGWNSKQWPLEHYEQLGAMLRERLGMRLVLNGPGRIETPSTLPHASSLAGLIYATRRASAVVGVDSGPTHIAAALGRPGVAIFGPTDPARNGPYGTSFTVLRDRQAQTTYKRGLDIDPSMRAITPLQVFDALVRLRAGQPAGRP